ncbi:MAG: AAA family ATPase [Patescibacteria group bacterium]
MKNKIIIGIVGEMAAGKGTVVTYLKDKHKASSHRYSTPLRDILDILHLDINRKNLQDIFIALSEKFGPDILAKAISNDAEKDQNRVVIIEGIRMPSDIDYLRRIPEFKLIYLTADVKTRYSRLTQRHENIDDKNKTFDQFLKDHEAETEVEIKNIGKTADFKIDNSKGLEELYAQIDTLIK